MKIVSCFGSVLCAVVMSSAASFVCYADTPEGRNIDTGKSEFRTVYLDEKGVIRWRDDQSEVGLFGANYTLPSAGDYRAAGYVSENRKKMIDQDMAHFARMGWDGLRLASWGDSENSDKAGNLIKNDHLDLLDYLIYKAKERHIYMLLTGIHVYSSLWPDAMDKPGSVDGFSTHYGKSELGKNPAAIAAQVNYTKQLLNHVNPYTGIALKDEPAILFIELINEPQHHSGDLEGSVNYINTLADAVKSTGARQLLFYNLTQDRKIAPAIKVSKVDGVSFGWYPHGLVSGYTLNFNNLRTVDDYPPMRDPGIAHLPRIVYEFDEADSNTPYMYPAMARTFRSVGAQFVSMFAYDMLATAPYNLGWQTHLMNMVYYPQKAIGAMIAAEIMHVTPRWESYGQYPDNTRWGPFRVSYEEHTSEMLTDEKFIHANHTKTKPGNVGSLKKIAGYGSSPLVSYPGQGLYFLDKVENGLWRLEVYPDARIISDPFAQQSPDRTVARLIHRDWPMEIKLPDLGRKFYVHPVNQGNHHRQSTKSGSFTIRPGVYVLSKQSEITTASLPEKIGEVKFNEFVVPEKGHNRIDLVHRNKAEYLSAHPVMISAEVISDTGVEKVDLYWRNVQYRSNFAKVAMIYESGYEYRATIPKEDMPEGYYEYFFALSNDGKTRVFPSGQLAQPDKWGFQVKSVWNTRVVGPDKPLVLFTPSADIGRLEFTRIGDTIRHGIYDLAAVKETGDASIKLYFPVSYDSMLDDYTMSLSIKDKVERGSEMNKAKGVSILAKSGGSRTDVFLTFIESDGTSWSSNIQLSETLKNYYIPLAEFRISRGVKLPLGYPERWNYWLTPAKNRGAADDRLRPREIEKFQISLRPAEKIDYSNHAKGGNPWVEVVTARMHFHDK